MMDEKFVHKSIEGHPSDSIRLLAIRPNVGGQVLQCRFSIARLSENPDFVALSYVWGGLPPTEEMELGGKRFYIRRNLWELLSHVRRPKSLMIVWVDAVCINQDDIPERNSQVGLMSQIFGVATLVIAWLGEAKTNAGRVLLPYVKPSGKFKASCLFLSDINACWREFQSRSPERRRTILRAWDAILELCQLDYWTRKWIIQEVVLARNVVICYGTVKIPWLLFSMWVNTIRGVEKDMIGDPDPYYNDDNIFFLNGELRHLKVIEGCAVGIMSFYMHSKHGGDAFHKKPLEALIPEFQNTCCSDPRDSIYALLSLANDQEHPHSIRADYNKTQADVFFDFMSLYVHSTSFWLANLLRDSLKLTLDDLHQTSLQGNRTKDRFSAKAEFRGILQGVLHTVTWSAPFATSSSMLQFVFLSTVKLEFDSEDEEECDHIRPRQCIRTMCRSTTPIIALLVGNESARVGDVLMHFIDTTVWPVYTLRDTLYYCIGRLFPITVLARTPITELQRATQSSYPEPIEASDLEEGAKGRVYFGRDVLVEALATLRELETPTANGELLPLGPAADFCGALAFENHIVEGEFLLERTDRFMSKTRRDAFKKLELKWGNNSFAEVENVLKLV